MKRLKVTVYTRDKDYSLALAKGLCMASRGMEIRIAENMNEALMSAEEQGIVLTDICSENLPGVVFLSEDRENDRGVYKRSSVEEIAEAVKDTCLRTYGRYFDPDGAGSMKIYRLRSFSGGTGVTSAAVTLASIFAAEAGKQVLYLNLSGPDDYLYYTGADFAKTESKKKFAYAADTGGKVHAERCFTRDKDGVWYLRPDDGENCLLKDTTYDKIIDFLRNSNKFTHVIIDGGKEAYGKDRKDETVITLFRYGALKRDSYGEEDIEVINFSPETGCGNNIIYLPEDKKSFSEKDGKVRISPEGDFFEGVSCLRSVLEKEAVLSVFVEKKQLQ